MAHGFRPYSAADLERGLECCDEALALAPIPYDVANARAVRGYGHINAGRLDAGIAELTDAVAWFESFHLRQPSLRWALWLAEGHLLRGDHASARPLINEVLSTSRETGYLHLEGLACCLMGECLADQAPTDNVKTAIQILGSIGARNDLAKKAMVTRARLRQGFGDLVTARMLLVQAHAIFEALGTRHEPARVEAALAALGQPARRPAASRV